MCDPGTTLCSLLPLHQLDRLLLVSEQFCSTITFVKFTSTHLNKRNYDDMGALPHFIFHLNSIFQMKSKDFPI